MERLAHFAVLEVIVEPPIPLTVAIIARDEADRILDAISSARFAAEVLVVEAGSSDGTAEVARAAGARVVVTDWPGFVRQKQRATDLASHDWVFSLDADEVIPPDLAREVAAAVRSPGSSVAFSVPRRTWWQGMPIRYGTWSPDRRCRLFRATAGRWSGTDPHDRWEPSGPVGRLEAPIHHHAFRDLRDHLLTIARYAELQAEQLRSIGRRARWFDWSVRPFLHLAKALFWKKGILDGPRGVSVAFLGAAHVALKWGLVALKPDGPVGTGSE